MQGGVFSIADLKNLINPINKASLYRALDQLCQTGVIVSFCRGFYTTKQFNLQILSQRLCPVSYVTFGTVLAQNLIIGSVPTYRLMAVKRGPTRIYESNDYIKES